MQAIIVLTLSGLIMSIVLVAANKVLSKKNAHEYAILRRLPGLNCGACGYGSCEGMVQAMLDNLNNYKKCRPLRGEKLIEMEKYVIESKDKI